MALTLAVAALIAAALPSPGLYAAIGLGIAAIGSGCLGYARQGAPGARRLTAAAAITVGALGCMLGIVRVIVTFVAIAGIDRMLG